MSSKELTLFESLCTLYNPLNVDGYIQFNRRLDYTLYSIYILHKNNEHKEFRSQNCHKMKIPTIYALSQIIHNGHYFWGLSVEIYSVSILLAFNISCSLTCV